MEKNITDNRLMNLILETIPILSCSMGFIIFHRGNNLTVESGAIETREEKRAFEKKRVEDRRRGGSRRCRCIAGTGDKQKDRSVAGNIRVK